MAITNAQQCQQLVNKPADGKRPGYRGDAAYRSFSAQSTGSQRGSATRSEVGGGRSRDNEPSLRDDPTVSQNVKDSRDDEIFKQRRELKKEVERQEKEKAEEKVERFRNKQFTGLPFPGVTSFLNPLFKKGMTVNRNFFLDKVLGAGRLGNLTPEEFANLSLSEQEAAYKDYMSNRLAGKTDAYGNPTRGFSYDSEGNLVGNFIDDGGPDQPIIPMTPTDPTDPTDPTTTPPSTGVFAGIAPRFAGSTFDFDKLRAGAMDGGMIEDTPVGGIMDLESGRQMYFLGKLVKKAKRAVKKVVKSPFGKIALLGLGAGMAGFGPAKGLFASGKGLGFKKFLTDSIMGKAIGVDSPAGGGGIIRSGGLLNFVKNNPYKSIFAGSALLGLMGDKDDDGFDIDKYYKTAGLGGQEGIDAIRLQGLNALSNRFRVADGGRIGLKDGPSLESILEGRIPPMPMPDPLQKILEKMTPEEKEMFKMRMEIMKRGFIRNIEPNPDAVKPVPMPTYGPDGKRSFAEGGDVEPVAKKTMPLIDMDGKEKDYRETGGFVDMGRMERADDVPARLSKNEFVFTADAVRNAGEGDIDKGAEVMYNMMKNLEAGGEVSEESQGLEGARKMFQTSQRLGEVI